MCVGQLGSLLPHVVVPSILAAFLIPEWHLTGAQAGLLAGSGAAGYMLTVPVLATLTDRIDARKILIAGSTVSALGTLLFGLFATGLWSGAFFNAIAGIGFAGAYMPGLKALTDRLASGDSSRAVTLYTSSFSFGVGLSFLVSQLVAEAWGWRAAFLVTALGPLVMLSVCLLLRPVTPKPAQGRLLDFAPVFRNTHAMGFVLGYGAHCFELYGIRTWLVAFWTFVAMKHSDAPLLTPVVVSVLFSVLAMLLMPVFMAGLMDGRRPLTHPPYSFAPISQEAGGELVIRDFYKSVLAGKRVLLVDDVRNTGKTFERAKALIEAAGGHVIATAEIYDRMEAIVDLGVPNIALAEYKAPDNYLVADCPMCKDKQPITTF